MKNKMRTLSITAALAVMIPLSAYAAATNDGASDDKSAPPAWSAKGGAPEGRGEFGKGGHVSQEVLDLLKLDESALKEKLKSGSTLAEIAEAQGVSRDSLKQAMTEAFNKRIEERKAKFADSLDKVIDAEQKAGHHGRGRGPGHGFGGERPNDGATEGAGASGQTG